MPLALQGQTDMLAGRDRSLNQCAPKHYKRLRAAHVAVL